LLGVEDQLGKAHKNVVGVGDCSVDVCAEDAA
jgi:hypothetical protein